MTSPDYLKPYQDALKEHGPTFEATLWRNADYQLKRFAVIADLLGDPLGVIADMGCGRADLLVHLVTIGVGFKRYIGVEGVEGLHVAEDLLEIPRHGGRLLLGEGPSRELRHVGDVFGADGRHPGDVSTACGDEGGLPIASAPGEGYGAARI